MEVTPMSPRRLEAMLEAGWYPLCVVMAPPIGKPKSEMTRGEKLDWRDRLTKIPVTGPNTPESTRKGVTE